MKIFFCHVLFSTHIKTSQTLLASSTQSDLLCGLIKHLAHLHYKHTFQRASFMFYSHLLHNWVSEWIFSTPLEAGGLEDQLLPGSPESCCYMMMPAATNSPSVYQMFDCALPSISLWSWWTFRAAADFRGRVRRDDGECARCNDQNEASGQG